jgi:hypothetical protein
VVPEKHIQRPSSDNDRVYSGSIRGGVNETKSG